jgi:hypothetical protein
VGAARTEAVAAIDRLVAAGLERNFRYAAALAARRSEHFARAAAAHAIASAATRTVGTHRFPRLTAILATVGLVLKTFLFVKALLARAEDEFPSAVHAVQHFICVHETESPFEVGLLDFATFSA